MKGEWQDNAMGSTYVAGGRRHATVVKARNHDTDEGDWLVYTDHTEGNDRLHTLDDAKAHALKRLQKLLDATESLR